MNIKLRTDHGLFKRLAEDPPIWWKNLKADPDLYMDVRKDNYINVYYNGGSILKLGGGREYKAEIHFEYIPLQRDRNYVPFCFDDEGIQLEKIESIAIDNFHSGVIEKIKKRIRKFYPNDSEKGIQGRYVTRTHALPDSDGFFIDTEFAHEDKRIDLVWVDLKTSRIALVELKTIGDSRLYLDKQQSQETIDKQLQKYYDFARQNAKTLTQYYTKIFSIKSELGLLPAYATREVESLDGFELIEKPILLVGDCSNKWIERHSPDIDGYLKDIAFGCLYRGKGTQSFEIPDKTSGHVHRLD